jgi:hypothetical protein
MKKNSVYKNFYKNILSNDIGLAFPVENIYKVPRLQKITIHNTSNQPLLKRGEIFSPWAASLLFGGRRGKLLVSKKSVAGFKLKEKTLLGCCLTLRKEGLYRFLDLLLLETLPRELITRQENWIPGMEWDSLFSLGEFILPLRFALGIKDVRPGSGKDRRSLLPQKDLFTAVSPKTPITEVGPFLYIPLPKGLTHLYDVNNNSNLLNSQLEIPFNDQPSNSIDDWEKLENKAGEGRDSVPAGKYGRKLLKGNREFSFSMLKGKRGRIENSLPIEKGIPIEKRIPFVSTHYSRVCSFPQRGSTSSMCYPFGESRTTGGESSISPLFLSSTELRKRISETPYRWKMCNPKERDSARSLFQGTRKPLSKEYNLGVEFPFSFRELESSFHLFEELKGFDIAFLFSTPLKISSPELEELTGEFLGKGITREN